MLFYFLKRNPNRESIAGQVISQENKFVQIGGKCGVSPVPDLTLVGRNPTPRGNYGITRYGNAFSAIEGNSNIFNIITTVP